MSKKGREFKVLMEKTLKELGVRVYEFGVTGGGHQYIRIDEARYYFPSTPSDRRGALNARAGLKRWVLSRAEGPPISAVPKARPLLDAGRVSARQPNPVGGRRGSVHRCAPAVAVAVEFG